MEGIVANHNYKPGDVIYTESPFVKIVKREFKDVLCAFCLQRSSSLLTCKPCLVVKYCGKDCQKNDWSSHRLECKHLKNLPEGHLADDIRLLGKVILKIKGKDWRLFKCKVLGKEFSFDDIDSHYKEMTENPRMILFFNEMKELTGNYIGFENLPDDERLMKIISKVKFGTKDMHEVTGFFIGAANFTSECIPNSNTTSNGNAMKIWACKKIRKGKDKISVPGQGILSRKMWCADGDSRSCKCTDCSLPYGESILFQIIDKKSAYRLIVETESFLNGADSCPDISMFPEYQQIANRLLREQEGVFGNTNYLRMRLLHLICFKIERNPIYKIEMLLRLEISMRSVFGEYYFEMWPIYKKLYSTIRLFGDVDAAMEYSEKAKFIEKRSYQW